MVGTFASAFRPKCRAAETTLSAALPWRGILLLTHDAALVVPERSRLVV
jgi:hypothetical protein